MTGTASEKILSFKAREKEEGQLIRRIPSSDFYNIILYGIMCVKYVVCYYNLKENK